MRLRCFDQALVTAIDIPIGLPGGRPRTVDGEARRLLGPRASSVFPAPARGTLDASSYEEACEASRKLVIPIGSRCYHSRSQ
jgi:predicted RNase H-like nuclease